MGDQEKQRNFIRIENEFNVRLVKESEGGKYTDTVIETGKSLNVSGSGLLINTDEPLEKGMIVSITFMKPNSFDFFKSKGEVVRVVEGEDKTYKVAINFINLTDQDKKSLEYYLTLGKS